MSNASYLFFGGKKSAYCPDVENYAKKHGQFIDKKNGKAGDIALMDFGKGRASHTGIVVGKSVLGYKIIEGNTSLTSNDNGGKVMERTRAQKSIRGFYRPKYDSKVTAAMIVSKAKAELGTKENPSGSNKVKYNKWFYRKDVSGSGYPWCMAFVSWIFAHVEQKAVAVAVSVEKKADVGKATVNVKKAASKPKETTGTVTASALNVRKEPNIKASKCSFSPLKKGTKVTIVSKEKNGWYLIRYNKKQGYVSGKYIK